MVFSLGPLKCEGCLPTLRAVILQPALPRKCVSAAGVWEKPHQTAAVGNVGQEPWVFTAPGAHGFEQTCSGVKTPVMHSVALQDLCIQTKPKQNWFLKPVLLISAPYMISRKVHKPN